MSELVISVLGTRNAGKSETWKTLVGSRVRTGTHSRPLQLTPEVCVDVFLVSGSAEERHTDIETILRTQTPDIILCSVQYHQDARDTFQFFLNHNYDLIVHWL